MDLAFDAVVPVKGLEPSWGHPRLILSQLRIPFRHTGRQRVSVTEEGRAFIGARQIERFLSASALRWLYCAGLNASRSHSR